MTQPAYRRLREFRAATGALSALPQIREAPLDRFGCYSPHSNALDCPKYGKKGAITWEDVLRDNNPDKNLLGIEVDFLERLAKKPPYPIEVVCNGCDAFQPG